MFYFIPDIHLWEEVKARTKPVKKQVKHDPPKRLRVMRGATRVPDSVLDLHGLTIQKAFETTCSFIVKARRTGVKEITVITGRGTTGRALIKNEFTGWLDNPKIKAHIRTYEWQNRGGAIKISLKKSC